MICFAKKEFKKVDICNLEEAVKRKDTTAELLLIYKEGKYCGFACRTDEGEWAVCQNILLTSFELSDQLFEQIENHLHVGQQSLLPIMGTEKRGTLLTAYSDDALEYYPRNYELLEEEKSLLWEWLENKKAVCLPELDERTWRIYQMLLRKKISCLVKGEFWRYFGVKNQNMTCSEKELLYYDEHKELQLFKRISKARVKKMEILHDKAQVHRIIIPCSDELNALGKIETEMKNQNVLVSGIRAGRPQNGLDWLERILKVEKRSKAEFWNRARSESYGKADSTIYLVGSCIVGGDQVASEEDTLASILYQKLKQCNLDYTIKKISVMQSDLFLAEAILNISLSVKDFLFVVMDSDQYDREPDDVDLLEDYNRRPIDGWWFTNCPIHTLRRGNEMIAEKLLSIVESAQQKNGLGGYLQVAKPYLTREQKAHLQAYKEQVQYTPQAEKCVGCIVMNANPFTKGHLYLAEKAAAAVDELLVFVVEEDLSEFSFADRYEMVKDGLQHLTNVRVLPSGEFILSSYTFVSYFEKDKRQDERVDAAGDVSFFGSYIARMFGIAKRFLGEEPSDSVTRQYNEKMKQMLPYYGVEVIEIPRIRRTDSTEPISASAVRKLYQAGLWKELEDYLPDTTLSYLREHAPVLRDKAVLREEHAAKVSPYREEELAALNSLFEENRKVVLYGIGADGRGMYQTLPNSWKQQVVFCDRRAELEDCELDGKQVYPPDELQKELSDFPIIVTSTQHGIEIRRQLHKQEIPYGRVFQNTISYWRE